MRRPTYRRAAKRRGPDRRIIAAVAVLVAFGALIGVTQISNADESKTVACQAPADPAAPAGKKAATDPKVGTYTDKDGDVQHKGDGQLAKGEQAPAPAPVEECKTGNTTAKQVNGLQILANSCEDSQLEPHDGFQKGNRCVSTEFGEVGDAAKNPTLLITDFPNTVPANTPFTLKVSTRNLVRDRFLAAGQGGYYVESSVLTAEGLVRGHFHTACRMLSSTSEAVDPAPVPAFFVATEDRRGGAEPDTVTIQVPGLPQEGVAQCASWAGDGSHRIPMMQRANQTPAFDAVRVKVEGGQPADPPPSEPTDPPASDPPASDPPASDPPASDPPADNGDDPTPGDTAGTTTPKTETGTTPPKTGTVTIPKPAKTTRPATATGNGSADSNTDGPAQEVAGKTTKPTPTKKQTTEKPAAEIVSNGDNGAPDPEPARAAENVQTENKSKLALTGANSMTIILGGALLVLSGLVLLGATRRRRAASRD